MPSYCTVTEVRTFNFDDEMDEDVLDLLIPAVSEAIDTHCRQSFAATSGARLYDYVAGDLLKLREPLLSLTSLATNAGQSFVANDFTLEPYSGPPYYRLRLKSPNTFWYSGASLQAITVTGSWGWAASVPAGVKAAAILWVSDLYATADVRGLGSVGGGGIRAALQKLGEGPPKDALSFLAGFVNVRIEALA